MTERLYYHDLFLREFDARVLSCEPAEERFVVLLDKTAFYPTSGGQPFDRGKIGEVDVVDVNERDDGAILHKTERAVPVGPVHGVVDWERRFDHMQQHTGQHLLSAAFVSLFRFPTVSFHLGRQVSTIDLEARSVVERHLEEAERLTNQVIFEDRAVGISFRGSEELERLGVRKKVEREGTLRVIEIERFDLQPCGGTHVTRTGQVGMILLRKLERVKQNWRVEFVCGFRALAAARGDFATLGEAAHLFSCGLPEVPAMVGKQIEEGKEGHRARQRLLERLAEVESRALLAAETVTVGGRTKVERAGRVVVRVFEDAQPGYLRLLAAKLVAEPGICALLGTRAGGHLVFAQSAQGPGEMNALLREAVSAVGGKGGGTRDFAQGSVPDPALLDAVVARAAAQLSS